jgi:thiol-disulfide isomerase/thioredoxin
MKNHLIAILLFGVFQTYFAQNQQNGFKLKGNIQGENYKGYMYLMYDGKKDSCLVINNKFEFQGSVKYASGALIGTDYSPADRDIYLENTAITLNVMLKNEDSAAIVPKLYPIILSLEGTETEKLQSDFTLLKSRLANDENYEIKMYEKLVDLAKKHPRNSFVGNTLLGLIDEGVIFTAVQLQTIVGTLDLDYQNSNVVPLLLQEIEHQKNPEIEQRIIDFSLPSLDNNVLSPTQFAGKYLLIDFWDTACAPCRAQFPALKKIYENYGTAPFKEASGFEILAVSFDKTAAIWKKTLAKEKVRWTNVLATEGFKSKVAIDYRVRFIPHNVLYDANGKLIAKDLSPNELEAFLKSCVK